MALADVVEASLQSSAGMLGEAFMEDLGVNNSPEMDEWKKRHGMESNRDVNQDELLMAAEESQSKTESWCIGCDKHMPAREMKLITRSIDPYKQMDEGETDYISKSNRVRMCLECFKEEYEVNQPPASDGNKSNPNPCAGSDASCKRIE